MQQQQYIIKVGPAYNTVENDALIKQLLEPFNDSAITTQVNDEDGTTEYIFSSEIKSELIRVLKSAEQDGEAIAIVEEAIIVVSESSTVFAKEPEQIYPIPLNYANNDIDMLASALSSDIEATPLEEASSIEGLDIMGIAAAVSGSNHSTETQNNESHTDNQFVNQISLSSSINDLVPSSSDVMQQLNSTIDIDTSDSPFANMIKIQTESNLAMMLAMNADIVNVDANELETALANFKRYMESNPSIELQRFNEALKRKATISDNTISQADSIKANRQSQKEQWLLAELELLAQEYDKQYPDTTDSDIEKLYVEMSPLIEEADKNISETRAAAENEVLKTFLSQQPANTNLGKAVAFISMRNKALAAVQQAIDSGKDGFISNQQHELPSIDEQFNSFDLDTSSDDELATQLAELNHDAESAAYSNDYDSTSNEITESDSSLVDDEGLMPNEFENTADLSASIAELESQLNESSEYNNESDAVDDYSSTGIDDDLPEFNSDDTSNLDFTGNLSEELDNEFKDFGNDAIDIDEDEFGNTSELNIEEDSDEFTDKPVDFSEVDAFDEEYAYPTDDEYTDLSDEKYADIDDNYEHSSNNSDDDSTKKKFLQTMLGKITLFVVIVAVVIGGVIGASALGFIGNKDKASTSQSAKSNSSKDSNTTNSASSTTDSSTSTSGVGSIKVGSIIPIEVDGKQFDAQIVDFDKDGNALAVNADDTSEEKQQYSIAKAQLEQIANDSK